MAAFLRILVVAAATLWAIPASAADTPARVRFSMGSKPATPAQTAVDWFPSIRSSLAGSAWRTGFRLW